MHKLRGVGVPFQHIAHIPNHEMIAFMSEFDMFVLPSLEDGFAVVVSEAQLAGLPVVATANTGAADGIVEGCNGYVVPAQDAVALAEAILKAQQFTPRPLPLGTGGLRVTDWHEYARHIAKLWRTSLEQHATTPTS